MNDKCDEACREPQVSEQINNIERKLSSLESIAQTLAGRLSPVLTDQAPTPQPDAKEPRTLVPVALELRKFTVAISSVNQSLDSILARLEL